MADIARKKLFILKNSLLSTTTFKVCAVDIREFSYHRKLLITEKL